MAGGPRGLECGFGFGAGAVREKEGPRRETVPGTLVRCPSGRRTVPGTLVRCPCGTVPRSCPLAVQGDCGRLAGGLERDSGPMILALGWPEWEETREGKRIGVCVA
eukprot:8863-Chlamydomonas_euryale.AAC.1